MKMPEVLLSNLRDMVFERNIEKVKSILELSPDEKLIPEEFVTLDEVNLIVLESLEEEDVNHIEESENILYSISLSASTLKSIFYKIKTRIFTNYMSKLVSRGFFECAFSEEDNDFIFSVSEKGKKHGIEKIPEWL